MAQLWRTLFARPAAVSGVLLVLSTVVALVWANSGAAESYTQVWSTPFRIGYGAATLEKPLILWVNDLLMAVFFLLVGLEIKREIFEGALTSLKLAALPLAAAVGGVAVPVGVYFLVTGLMDGDQRGWAVPAATDIAFALGILALLGDRVPLGMKVFLTTVAVVDDLMAVLIIAIFLTENVSLIALGLAGACWAALFMLGKMDVRRATPYVLLGLLLWLAVLKSGLHATIAGVLLATTLPMKRGLPEDGYLKSLRELVPVRYKESLHGLAPDSVADKVTALSIRFSSPVLRWEHGIQPWVLFGIVPVFALANAGVNVTGGGSGAAAAGPLWQDPNALGVGLGLLLGKPIGITLCSLIVLKLRWGAMPTALTVKGLIASSFLAGIGFTMSLFIAGIALDGSVLGAAQIGLLCASAIAALLGATLVWSATAPAKSA